MSASTPAVEIPAISRSPRRMVLLQHVVAPHDQLKQTFDKVFGELYAKVGIGGVAPAGPPFVIYNKPSQPGVLWDMDICAPVSAPVAPPVGLEFREMPAERVVSMLHRGPYDGLGEAYRAIERFVADNALAFAGAPREIYLSEPDVPPAQVMTLIEWPIE